MEEMALREKGRKREGARGGLVAGKWRLRISSPNALLDGKSKTTTIIKERKRTRVLVSGPDRMGKRRVLGQAELGNGDGAEEGEEEGGEEVLHAERGREGEPLREGWSE